MQAHCASDATCASVWEVMESMHTKIVSQRLQGLRYENRESERSENAAAECS